MFVALTGRQAGIGRTPTAASRQQRPMLSHDIPSRSIREGTRHPRRVGRRIAALIGFAAATLAVISLLHLAGFLGGGSRPFRPTGAGIAEAVIGLALAYGAATLLRGARSIALATTGLAILGVVVGLNFTVRGGDAIDIAYHATMLPLLLLTMVVQLRDRERS
jgi:hypothetical protein